MALSQSGDSLGVALLIPGDAFAVTFLLATPAIQLLEDRGGDGRDQTGAAGDSASKERVHVVGVGKKDEDRLSEMVAASGFDESDGDVGAAGEIGGYRQYLGDAAGDFGVGVVQMVEERGQGGFAELCELFLGGIAVAEVIGAESGDEVGGARGLGGGWRGRRGRGWASEDR